MFFSLLLTSLFHSNFGPEITVLAKITPPKLKRRYKANPTVFLLTAEPVAACRALLCCSSSLTVIFTLTPWYTLGFPGRICGEKNTLQRERMSEQTANPAGCQVCSMWRTSRFNITNFSLFAITLTAPFNTCCSSLGQADTHENLAVDNI